ncbi:hypothetical protein CPB83DRAFT_862579 [Crepidotus variabilis]|uniref:Uncharacterized protein n=1 Tax=Crepidotus variabilis TaxID=179855 RepID=A0A9P6JJT5_9AGAR|nr:hypothetical protein CPB83DRAFT_862579 [Crepidotus variabilis]
MVQISLISLAFAAASILPSFVVGAPVSDLYLRDDVSSSESLLVRDASNYHIVCAPRPQTEGLDPCQQHCRCQDIGGSGQFSCGGMEPEISKVLQECVKDRKCKCKKPDSFPPPPPSANRRHSLG